MESLLLKEILKLGAVFMIRVIEFTAHLTSSLRNILMKLALTPGHGMTERQIIMTQLAEPCYFQRRETAIMLRQH
ncbi:hypothetical protein AGF18_28530 [Klebsiella oxytoca]|nr:hypothetical protein AGF18_28530 [Klebsiella oxytoca]